jgi:integrase/recombinase XerD
MASIFKPTYTKTDPKTGKKVTKRLKKWYVKYRDSDDRERKVPGFTDKSATLQLAARLEREAELARQGMGDPYHKQRKRPLKDHIDEFERHLRDRGNSADHVRLTLDRVRKICASCKFVFMQDISASRVQAFLGDLRRGDEAKSGRSIQTCNHYLGAIKEFCRWLVMDRRCGDNPLTHLQKQNVATDRRHDRRALTAGEFSLLVESAMHGPPVEGVSGPDRAMLYIVAAWTGLRRRELSSLTLRSLDLDKEPPEVCVEAAYSKRRRQDRIPLHPVVVERLKQCSRLFILPRSTPHEGLRGQAPRSRPLEANTSESSRPLCEPTAELVVSTVCFGTSGRSRTEGGTAEAAGGCSGGSLGFTRLRTKRSRTAVSKCSGTRGTN